MQVAMYKGPPVGWQRQLAHRTICAVTHSIYSHCELLIDGVGYSASSMDGGVRAKPMDLSTGRWDLYQLNVSKTDPAAVLAFFERTKGMPYDTAGELDFVVPWMHSDPKRYFCSKWCGEALGAMAPWTLTPQGFLDWSKGAGLIG